MLLGEVSIKTNSISDRSILPVDDDISFVFSRYALGFSNSSILSSVFGGDTFIPFSANCPAFLIRNNMLMPCSWSGRLSRTLEDGFNDFQ